MSDSEPEDIEAIREQKRQRIRNQLASADEPIHVESADQFRDRVSEGVTLVDFYADWCGPCKMLEPTVEAIAAETAAEVLKVDVDAHQALAAEFEVQGVPTVYLFEDGEPVERVVGVKGKDALLEMVNRYT